MGIGDLVAKLAADHPQAALIVALFLVWALETLLGCLAAWRTGTFKWSLVDVSVRTQVAGRILPIVLVLLVGSVFPPVTIPGIEFTFNPLMVAANTGAALYLTATGISIADSLRQVAAPAADSTPPDPPPTE